MTEISFAYILKEGDVEIAEIECEMEVDCDGEVLIKIWPLNGGLVNAPPALAKKIEDWFFKDQERCGEYQVAKAQARAEQYYTEKEDARAMRAL